MPVNVSGTGGYTPHPEARDIPTRCMDVIDLGVVKYQNSQYAPKRRVRLIFWMMTTNPATEKNWEVRRDFSASLHPKSALNGFLTKWRGAPFTKDEMQSFDLETLIGVTGMADIENETSEDGTIYDRIALIRPEKDGEEVMTQLIPGVDKYERTEYNAAADVNAKGGSMEATEQASSRKF